MADYTSQWEGEIETSKEFNLNVAIENLGLENATFKISNSKSIVDYPFKTENVQNLHIPFTDNQFFEGVISENGQEINGFIKSGMLFYHVKLKKSKSNLYTGVWNVLMVDELKSQNFFLSVENGLANEYQAYPILGDDRFTGTWCDNFQKENNIISFTDFKTGLQFEGKLLPNEIQLSIFLGKHLLTQIQLSKSVEDWKIGGFNSNSMDSSLQLSEMEKLISNDSLLNTHSVLVSTKGRVVYENYFHGYNSQIPHDTRSASKSISSAIVGVAKDQSLFQNMDTSIFEFLPMAYQQYKDSLKAKIDIQSLLTMSSGLDAIDYGLNANLKSTAVEDNYQPSRDWTESILKASMIHNPKTKANYGSANPYLLGVALDSMIEEPLELFMDKNLFQKLEISNYVLQGDTKGRPYFGGGMYLTSADLLKFGELYLNKGKWNSKQILSRKWVKDSFENYLPLENVPDKNGYGYLWWHHTYIVNGKRVASIEARGAGGQYIFVVPSLKTVAVITSGNYRNSKSQQPELIFEKYILPNLL
jgi:CubicO group peptidase (beta-lactamase class C family)